jgi:hypothetical protein
LAADRQARRQFRGRGRAPFGKAPDYVASRRVGKSMEDTADGIS